MILKQLEQIQQTKHKQIKPTQQIQQTQHSQQWIVVTKNRKKHKGSIKNKQIMMKGNIHKLKFQYQQQQIQKFVQSIAFQKNKILFEQKLNKLIQKCDKVQFHVQCLGLGNFLLNRKPFLQLQYLQKIILTYTSLHSLQPTALNIFDPIFTLQQIKHITKIKSCCKQVFTINPTKINIFFMPHCQRELYQEVYLKLLELKEIYNNEVRFVLIGNSIQDYKERCRVIRIDVPNVFKMISFHEDIIVDYQNAFNDTFILI